MRVLVTADAVGGVWTHVVDLASALVDAGDEVHVAVLGPAPAQRQVDDARAAGVTTIRHGAFALEWMDEPWDDLRRAGAWLLDVEADLRPDVVHLNGFALAAEPWRAPVLVGAHSDVVSWWRAVRGCDPPPVWDDYRVALRRGLDAAAVVVAPSRAMADALSWCHGIGDVVAVHNGRSRAWVVDEPAQPVLLAAGRLWDDAKNVAAARDAAEGLPWPLVTAQGLPFDELARAFTRASVFVHPARYEPFGLAPLEAAMSGCALVLGDIPSLREVWGDAASFVAPDDVAGLRRAIVELIDDPALLARRAAAARERARAYDPARMAAGYRREYRRITARAAAR